MPLIKRLVKGSPLTFAEGDANLDYLYIFSNNQTETNNTHTVKENQSLFNPSDLTVLTSSIFIVDNNAEYYVLGDLINSGSIVVSGSLKIGGALYNVGSITGPGIIV